MLDINTVRAWFAEYLAGHADKRHSLDAALMHVVERAYKQGADSAKSTGLHAFREEEELTRHFVAIVHALAVRCARRPTAADARPHMRRTMSALLPAWLSAGIKRAERERKADNVARPMRALLSQLARGEVHEYDGRPVMRIPEGGDRFAWCEIAPAIEGWCDCWSRIAPELSTYFLRSVSEYRAEPGVVRRVGD